jgi:hypothetical protein
MECLESLGDPRATSYLAAQMRRMLLPMPLRVRAAAALLTIAPSDPNAPAARELLEKQARSRKPDVRGLAEDSLARIALAGGPPVTS